MHEISWPVNSHEEIADSVERMAVHYLEEELIRAVFLKSINEYLAFFRRLQAVFAELGPYEMRAPCLETSSKFGGAEYSGMMRLAQEYAVAQRKLLAETGFLNAERALHWCALYPQNNDDKPWGSYRPREYIFFEEAPASKPGGLLGAPYRHIDHIRGALRELQSEREDPVCPHLVWRGD